VIKVLQDYRFAPFTLETPLAVISIEQMANMNMQSERRDMEVLIFTRLWSTTLPCEIKGRFNQCSISYRRRFPNARIQRHTEHGIEADKFVV